MTFLNAVIIPATIDALGIIKKKNTENSILKNPMKPLISEINVCAHTLLTKTLLI